MVLKAKIANKIVADDSGYTTGEIIDINEIDEHSEKEGKKLDKAKLEDSDIDLEVLIGQKIEFKMNKSIKRKGLSVIDIKSIKPIKSAK